MKVLVFDIASDYAHFRQPYSTTSSLTYAIPPRTAVLGIVGAILGIESGGFGKSEHVPKLENSNVRIGVRIMKPIEKVRFNMNYSYTKADAATKNVLHIQVPVEMVKEPIYRLHICADSPLFEKLERLVSKKECYYTPYLGITEFIARVNYIGTYEARILVRSEKIYSAIYMSDSTNFVMSNGQKIFRETHAVSMDNYRHVTEYSEIAYEAEGKPLIASSVDPESIVVGFATPDGEVAVMIR
ncbi:MAG TPA: type I-B CRISPR-associated protein Cas5 [Mesotoga infera]|uniref:Type I-B CRISPR-associated protein Cas5 n=1 Tax=Mesotoga infera TaxID=1236046 RepID=A0A7C1CV84_9BACT|nr:type I-B CRISPR-associated protein Cas5 [Mesotoga infera]